MRTLNLTLPVFFVLLLLASCGEDTEIDTSVNFRLMYEGSPLVMFENYNYPDGKDMNFTRISFYLENLQLVGEDETYTFIDREYINLTNDHLTSSQSSIGTSVATATIPKGIYKLQFGIGVSPEDNAKAPEDFNSSNLLSSNAEYWVGWKSYIFTRVEGKIDLNEDSVIEEGFALHMGADQAYRNITLTKEINISEDNPVAEVIINLDRLFGNDENMYDINANPQIHRPDQNDVMMQLVNNLDDCFE